MFFYRYILSKKHSRSLLNFFLIGNPTLNCVFYKKYNAIIKTRKYPLRGYFLGVLTHTTAWDRLWGGEQTQVWV